MLDLARVARDFEALDCKTEISDPEMALQKIVTVRHSELLKKRLRDS